MAMACDGNDELWRECAYWLTRLDQLRPDHKANMPNATIADLAHTLRDGVLLCNLVNKLDPGCVDPAGVSQKPAMAQFLSLRNINLFLSTCRTHFDIRESDLFEPSMLFDLTNFHLVLCTLSKLSNCPKVMKSNIEGFSAQIEKTEEEEEIYQSLKSVKPSQGEYGQTQFYNCGLNEHSECIYQEIFAIQDNKEAHLIGAQPLEKRDYVIKELIDTEKNYVEVLYKIKKYYISPLRNIIDINLHRLLFKNIEQFLPIHDDFKDQLLKIPEKTARLSDIFMKWREKFLIYGEFCSNLTDATTMLQEVCDANENVNMEITRRDKEANNGKFKLRDLLQVPMQRILKYHLLLEKLVDATDPNHEEYKELKRAREAMLDVASYINEMARDKDLLNVLKEIAKNLIWEHNDFKIESCGRLRHDGEIKVKDHSENKFKTRYVFVFDKYMFLTKQGRANQFLFRTKLDLADFKIDEMNNRPVINQAARWTYQWVMLKHDKSVVYTMSVKSVEIKEIMVKAIRDAIDNVRPSTLSTTTHRFEMYTFDRPVTCHHCSKYLKGSFFQGYVCRDCNIAVHKECIRNAGKCDPHAPSQYATPEVTSLQRKLWFAGEKDRMEASRLLEDRRNGTFLVRIRIQSDTDRYALSLKTDNGVKHMKICCTVDGLEQKYYLSISRYFNSIEEMVANYQRISLKENFERLEDEAKLEYPYRQIKAVALKSYHPSHTDHLRFEEGETVIVIEKNDNDSWAKGMTRRGTVGIFPMDYIAEKEEILYDAF